ncbi:DUF4003 family protein [Lysinibacillus sp. 54212]|uniref:DUF4003 family protein n=1 Tax=Lysinibacillus sp. 54212 TaxID=3119829 RepID=UPI002FC91493
MDFIRQLELNYRKVFNYTGGAPDLRVVVSMAAQYTFAGAVYSGVRHQEVVDRIEQGESFLSIFRTFGGQAGMQLKLAAHLLLNGNVEEEILRLKKNDALLQECKFARSPYRVVSALFVEDTAHAVRALALHRAMNKHHPILTTKSDFPYAILLTAGNEDDVHIRAKTMHEYYIRLKELDFKMGDTLQSLTQLMTLYSAQYEEQFALYVAKLKDELEQRDVKVKKLHYPFIGILALTATDTQFIENIIDLHKGLTSLKMFKGVEELALVVAIQKLVKDYGAVQEVIDVSKYSRWQELLEFSEFFVCFPSAISNGIGEIFNVDFNL